MNGKSATKQRFRILINYQYQYYPFTTASYFEMAARRRSDVKLYRLGDKLPKKIDLVLNVEPVGKFYRHPGAQCAYYEIDNHVILGADRHWYNKADYLYLAQWKFRDCYLGYETYELALAADPRLHKPFPEVKEEYDIGFLGNNTYERRGELVRELEQKWRVLTGSADPGVPYSKKLSKCKMLFNCSMNGDINMRFFESIAIGKLLITDRLPEQDKFFKENEHYAAYDNAEELVAKVRYYLNRECIRKSIARAGRERLKELHTYDVRLDEIIKRTKWISGAFQRTKV